MGKLKVRVFEAWPASDGAKPSEERGAISVEDHPDKVGVKRAARDALIEKGWNVIAVNFTAGQKGGIGMVATVTHDQVNKRVGRKRGKPVRRGGSQGGALGKNVAS